MAADHLTALLSDREAFGHWLSGFTDGEGNFHLTRHGKKLANGPSNGFQASFRLSVRMDDREIIEAIRDYFGCGNIYYWVNNRGHENDKPQVKFQVANAPDLAKVIIPHFERFPLRAKKARDFAIWRAAVEHLYQIQQRPRHGFKLGKPRWYTPEDVAYLSDLKNQIHQERRFSPESSHAPLPLLKIAEADSLPLFDDRR